MSAHDFPSFVLNKGNKKVSGHSDQEKEEDSSLLSLKLQEFGRTYRTISPLIIKSISQSPNGGSRGELAKLTKAQERMLSQTITHLGLRDESDLTNRSRYEISRSISELLSKTSDIKALQRDTDLVCKKLSENIDRFIAERTDIVSDRDTYLLADNNTTNLKIAAVKPALEFYRTLKSLSISNTSIDAALKQQMEIAILMAKDVCFNHDPKASLWDRELLFVSLIAPCMDLVKDSWLALLSAKFKSRKRDIFVLEKIALKLSKLRKSIEEQDMGHGEIIDSTLIDIAQAYSPMINMFNDINIDYGLKSLLINKQIALLDKHLAGSWDSSINDIKEFLSELSEDEVEKWIETEGSQPMSLLKLEKFFDFKLYERQRKRLLSVMFDDKDLTGESFYRLIQAWGLTDTLCKIKR